MLTDKNSQHYFDMADVPNAQHAFKTTSVVVLSLGILVALISFCGCCGAIKESNCLLMTVSYVRFSRLNVIILRSLSSHRVSRFVLVCCHSVHLLDPRNHGWYFGCSVQERRQYSLNWGVIDLGGKNVVKSS